MDYLSLGESLSVYGFSKRILHSNGFLASMNMRFRNVSSTSQFSSLPKIHLKQKSFRGSSNLVMVHFPLTIPHLALQLKITSKLRLYIVNKTIGAFRPNSIITKRSRPIKNFCSYFENK